jgi:hypothetical protein
MSKLSYSSSKESLANESIYDELSNQFDLTTTNVYVKLSNPTITKAISLNDKLKKTQTIWYLPNLDYESIITRLKNKSIGVSSFVYNNIIQTRLYVTNILCNMK